MSAEDHSSVAGALLDCPECGLPAEIIDSFTLDASPRQNEHVELVCVTGHWFTAPIDPLFVARPDTGGPDGRARSPSKPTQASAPTCSRLRRTLRRLKQIWDEGAYVERQLLEIKREMFLTRPEHR